MQNVQLELAELAGYLGGRREAVLQAWQLAIKRDPTLSTGDSLPRVQLLDHVPSMLATFERALGTLSRAGALIELAPREYATNQQRFLSALASVACQAEARNTGRSQ